MTSASLNAAIQQLMDAEVRPAKAKTKLFKETFNEFMSELLPILQRDPVFGNLLEREELVGSAASNLRVRLFNEFDVNLILKTFKTLPKRLQIEQSEEDGFVYFRLLEKLHHPSSSEYIPLPGAEDWSSIYRALRSVQDEDGFIHPYMVVDKLYGAVARAVPEMALNNAQFEVKERRHYPAVTVTLPTKHQGESISIDLVPVFRFDWDTVFPRFSYRLGLSHLKSYREQVAYEKVTWAIVPKPMRDDTTGRTWRLDFSDLDKRVFHNRRGMKDGIRLIKWLRNCQGGDDYRGTWHPLSSHIIRTAFLWQDNERRPWEADLGTILKLMIRKLARHLQAGRLDDFWCRGHNLLDHANVDPRAWRNMGWRLNRIANALEGSDPEAAVRRYFSRPKKRDGH